MVSLTPDPLLFLHHFLGLYLAEIEAGPSLEVSEEHSGREFQTYRVALTSFGGQRIRAWYSVPNDIPPGRKIAAVLVVPGYGGEKPIPTHLVVNGYAVLTLYPRGQGESRAEWELESGTKLTYHLEDPLSYYYRGAYMDCIRGLDFLCTRPEVDSERLGMWSRSQGGGLTLATACLDSRLSAAVAEQPFLSNYPLASTLTSSPYLELHDYLADNPYRLEEALSTLEYFDTLSLADGIECPTLVNVGMKDHTCPYATIMPVFESIRSQKAIAVYPDLPHSPCTDFNVQAMDWLRRYIG